TVFKLVVIPIDLSSQLSSSVLAGDTTHAPSSNAVFNKTQELKPLSRGFLDLGNIFDNKLPGVSVFEYINISVLPEAIDKEFVLWYLWNKDSEGNYAGVRSKDGEYNLHISKAGIDVGGYGIFWSDDKKVKLSVKMDTSKFIPETQYWVNNNPPDYANSPTIRTVLNDTIERLPIEDKYLNTPLLIKNFNAIKYLKVEAEEDVLFTGDWKIWVL